MKYTSKSLAICQMWKKSLWTTQLWVLFVAVKWAYVWCRTTRLSHSTPKTCMFVHHLSLLVPLRRFQSSKHYYVRPLLNDPFDSGPFAHSILHPRQKQSRTLCDRTSCRQNRLRPIPLLQNRRRPCPSRFWRQDFVASNSGRHRRRRGAACNHSWCVPRTYI